MNACPHCGCEPDNKPDIPAIKKRSTPQMRRQFVVFRQAFFHWRDHGDTSFRPKNADHLRYWLECEAGHFDVVKTIRVQSVNADKLAALLTAVLRTSDDDRLFIEADADLITVKRARSIAYDKLGHAEACKLFDEISDVLAANGMDAGELLREAEKAA